MNINQEWHLWSPCNDAGPTQCLGARHGLLGRAAPWGTQQLPRYFQWSSEAQFEVDGGIASLVTQQMKKVDEAVALKVHDCPTASPCVPVCLRKKTEAGLALRLRNTTEGHVCLLRLCFHGTPCGKGVGLYSRDLSRATGASGLQKKPWAGHATCWLWIAMETQLCLQPVLNSPLEISIKPTSLLAVTHHRQSVRGNQGTDII